MMYGASWFIEYLFRHFGLYLESVIHLCNTLPFAITLAFCQISIMLALLVSKIFHGPRLLRSEAANIKR